MKRKLLAGIAIATAVTVPGALALAQSANPSPATGDDAAAGQSSDWAGYAHVGYHLDPHWRLELQGGYHNAPENAADAPASPGERLCLSTPGEGCDPAQPSLGAYSQSANLVFDALPSDRWVDPFVGVGVSRFEPGTIALTNPAMRLMQTGPLGGADLGYQAVIGLAFRPHDRLHFDLSYRWTEGAAPGMTGLPTALTGRLQDQTVAITVRYALSTPRAAIAPAPFLGGLGLTGLAARSAPRTVVVETPSAPEGLAAEAAAAVGQTAVSASEGHASQVVVDGHADTTSAAAYNHRLAERRAKAMTDAMVSLGVPASAIDVRWGGQPTPPPETAAPAQPALEANASLASNPK